MKKRLIGFLLIICCAFLIPLTVVAGEGSGETCFLSLKIPSITTENLGVGDCSVGDFSADGFKYSAAGDFALILNSDIKNDILQGTLTKEDIKNTFVEDRNLYVAYVTPLELKEILEHLVSHVVIDMETETVDYEESYFEDFPSVSGMTVQYDASAPVGSRIYSITANNQSIDLTDNNSEYRLIASKELFDKYSEKSETIENLGVTYSDAVFTYIREEGDTFKSFSGERVVCLGAHARNIVGGVISFPLVIGIVVVLGIIVFIYRYKYKKRG